VIPAEGRVTPPRIHLIHALRESQAPIWDAFAAHWPEARAITGACGSPILSGMTDVHRALERKLATFLGYEDVMLFNSGFGGALGMLAGVLRRDDVAVMDARCHVSLIEGAKVSGARLAFFEDPSCPQRMSQLVQELPVGSHDDGHHLAH
jgi:7-keto-8-aminopelargonate synthetase-like enzyme